MVFCARHEDSLLLAVGARGLKADLDGDPVAFARQAIVNHATHFAGKASVEMLTKGYCPICFVNRALVKSRRHQGVTVDGWVDEAAEEAAQEQIRLQDRAANPPSVLVN